MIFSQKLEKLFYLLTDLVFFSLLDVVFSFLVLISRRKYEVTVSILYLYFSSLKWASIFLGQSLLPSLENIRE